MNLVAGHKHHPARSEHFFSVDPGEGWYAGAEVAVEYPSLRGCKLPKSPSLYAGYGGRLGAGRGRPGFGEFEARRIARGAEDPVLVR